MCLWERVPTSCNALRPFGPAPHLDLSPSSLRSRSVDMQRRTRGSASRATRPASHKPLHPGCAISNLSGIMSATPMMQQYQSIRRTLPEGTFLLFRLGDFYELFFEDAKIAAPILNVALTKRNGMPMCGVPFHAAEAYIGRLIKAGHRVAICDQISDPQPGRIVERQVSQI